MMLETLYTFMIVQKCFCWEGVHKPVNYSQRHLYTAIIQCTVPLSAAKMQYCSLGERKVVNRCTGFEINMIIFNDCGNIPIDIVNRWPDAI